MIHIEHVTKQYGTRHGAVTVLDDVNLTVKPGEKVGILGRNGAGKSTIIRLISGAERPSAGHIRREMSVSWPLAFGGAFQGTLTGLDNLRFICRVYGASVEEKLRLYKSFQNWAVTCANPLKPIQPVCGHGLLLLSAWWLSLIVF